MLFVLDDDPIGGALPQDSFDPVAQLLIGPDGDGSPQLRAKQRVKRLGQHAADVVVVVNEQAPKEGQVELPSERAGCLRVGRLTVSHPCQCSLEVALGLLEIALDLGQPALGGLDLPCQPSLLTLEQVERHGIGVVGIKQLLPLREQADQPALLYSPFACGIQAQPRQFFFQEGPYRHQLILRELDGRIVPGDGILDLLDAQGAELTVGALLLAADADEVGVGAAPAFGMTDDQPRPTLTAEDAALQVVRILAVALARQVLGAQQLLHPLPGSRIDQRLMLALIEHTLVADNADVVGMPQQPMQMRDGQRPTRRLWARQGRQAPLGQLGQQPADRPVAGGIRLKGPGHQRRTHRVNLDRPALQAIDDLPHVQVAERCLTGRAAVLRLLHQPLRDLGRQVAAVELRDRGHDAVQQQARWRLVDVLADAHQFGAGLMQRQVDRYVIRAVAGQAVNLVDDDVLDAVVLHVLEQPLQFRPVSRLSRLTALDELFDDHGLEVLGLALAGAELRRQGIAIRLIGLGRLALARRHPDIDHGRHSLPVITFSFLCHISTPFRLSLITPRCC